MIADPQRLQYLEAMGIATWVSRYRFTNALPTPQSEWQEPERREKQAPGERLHALLERSETHAEPRRQSADEAPARPDVARDRPAGETDAGGGSVNDEPVGNGRATPAAQARALLEGETRTQEGRGERSTDLPATKGGEASEASVAVSSTGTTEAGPPLRFSLTLAVLDSRWWLFLPGERELSSADQALLQQMLGAAGLPGRWQSLGNLRWPLMETPSTDPQGEAREGIEVFCAGQARRNGLTIDGAIVVGEEAWAPLVVEALEARRWPHPDTLTGSARVKRDSWALLGATGKQWRESVEKGGEGSDATDATHARA